MSDLNQDQAQQQQQDFQTLNQIDQEKQNLQKGKGAENQSKKRLVKNLSKATQQKIKNKLQKKVQVKRQYNKKAQANVTAQQQQNEENQQEVTNMKKRQRTNKSKLQQDKRQLNITSEQNQSLELRSKKQIPKNYKSKAKTPSRNVKNKNNLKAKEASPLIEEDPQQILELKSASYLNEEITQQQMFQNVENAEEQKQNQKNSKKELSVDSLNQEQILKVNQKQAKDKSTLIQETIKEQLSISAQLKESIHFSLDSSQTIKQPGKEFIYLVNFKGDSTKIFARNMAQSIIKKLQIKQSVQFKPNTLSKLEIEELEILKCLNEENDQLQIQTTLENEKNNINIKETLEDITQSEKSIEIQSSQANQQEDIKQIEKQTQKEQIEQTPQSKISQEIPKKKKNPRQIHWPVQNQEKKIISSDSNNKLGIKSLEQIKKEKAMKMQQNQQELPQLQKKNVQDASGSKKESQENTKVQSQPYKKQKVEQFQQQDLSWDGFPNLSEDQKEIILKIEQKLQDENKFDQVLQILEQKYTSKIQKGALDIEKFLPTEYKVSCQ